MQYFCVTGCEAYSFTTDGYRIFNVRTNLGGCRTHQGGSGTNKSAQELTWKNTNLKWLNDNFLMQFFALMWSSWLTGHYKSNIHLSTMQSWPRFQLQKGQDVLLWPNSAISPEVNQCHMHYEYLRTVTIQQINWDILNWETIIIYAQRTEQRCCDLKKKKIQSIPCDSPDEHVT